MCNQMNFAEFSSARCNNLFAGITAVIGIIGGIYFAINATNDFICKISNRKEKESNEDEFFCNVCCAEINENDEKTYAKCHICNKYICRNIKCATWLPKIGCWECQLCQTSNDSLAQTSSWVADQITFNKEKIICPPRARSEVYIPINDYNDSLMHFESVSQGGVSSNNITAEQKFQIREYVEDVVAKLLGGNLDTVSVNQLSKSENYLPDANIKKINNGTSQESASVRTSGYDFSDIPENRLRQMIRQIIAETMTLPPLINGPSISEIALDTSPRAMGNNPLTNNDFDQSHRTEHYFEPTIYQNLLATAVLNKIVDKRLKNNQNASEKNTVDGDDDLNDNVSLAIRDRNFNFENSSTSSGSSVEPRSDCSYPEVEGILYNNDEKSSELLRNSDRDSVMSDYLANHMIPLPDLNAAVAESEEDDYTSVTSSAVGEGTWEKNWFLKKKRSSLNPSVTSSSIGMLVPDPKEDIRAQIGDKTADEVSDLSELGSDSDDSLNSLNSQLEPINDRLINKHLIGGQNSKIILDQLIERSSTIANTFPNDAKPLYTDARNEYMISSKSRNEAINDKVNQQQSVTEQKDELVVPEGFNSISLAGSIAEREYKKWYNAVEMPNNPYTPEALRRRISGSKERLIDLPNISPTKDMNSLDLLNEPSLVAGENLKLENDYKRYSRDYYINSSLTAQEITQTRDVSDLKAKENREVNNNYKNININKSYQNKSRNGNKKHLPNDCHWTLATPVRRSSSLKYLNRNIISTSPSYLHASTYQKPSTVSQTRSSTSISFYNHYNNINAEDTEDNVVSNSHGPCQRSLTPHLKRRTVSMLSLFNVDNGRSSSMQEDNKKDVNILSNFEKRLLHKDLKRNSFRAASATTKDFVLNPLYEQDQFFNGDIVPKLRAKANQEVTHEKSNLNLSNTPVLHSRQTGDNFLF